MLKSNNVIKKGRCTGASTYKLKLSPENGKVEVEFEVDQNKNGVNWAIKFFSNNVQFASGTYMTAATSGSFSADQLSSFRSGTFKVVATRPGETCNASAAASF
ncbi:hypothetical protein MHU86_17271 [Fragilaria crotonensis]|nr:hypothetical protein MHU86_17271 [Fragilaria crotonensis]